MPGTNLQQILSHVDTAIGIRSNQDGVLQGNITLEETARIGADAAERTERIAADAAEATARAAADATEAAARSAADTTLQDNIDSETSARQSADTTLQNNINTKVSKSGDTMTGDLTMGSTADINMSPSRTVDGVDVSNLRDRVVTLENPSSDKVFAWANVDSNGNILGQNNISSVTEFGGSCRFDVFFSTNAAGTYTYMVTGSIIDGGTDNHVVVHSQSAGGFTISTRETNADCNEDHDFSILVVGE